MPRAQGLGRGATLAISVPWPRHGGGTGFQKHGVRLWGDTSTPTGRGEGKWKGFGDRGGLVSPTPTLALSPNAPYPPGGWLGGGGGQGCCWPQASALYKRALLIAQGSFQMKEKAKPHTRGAISALCDEWSLCHSVKMNISLR